MARPLTTNCGYHEVPTGKQQLIYFGPKIWVDVGFDPEYERDKKVPPKPGMSKIEALVDTGAQESCIDELLAAQLELPITDRRMVAGVGRMEVNVHLAQIHIPALKFIVDGAFAGVPLIKSGFITPVILGRSLRSYMSMVYDGRTGLVQLTRHG